MPFLTLYNKLINFCPTSSLITATLPDKSAIMEETDQELSRFVVNFISIKLKDLSTVVQTLDSAGLSRVASCWWKLPLTWLVTASYSAWHFFTDGIPFQGMGWGFDILQKFAVKFLAHGKIIPVKCNQISHPGLLIALSNIARLDPRKAQ